MVCQEKFASENAAKQLKEPPREQHGKPQQHSVTRDYFAPLRDVKYASAPPHTHAS
jgi:hypothetical protein